MLCKWAEVWFLTPLCRIWAFVSSECLLSTIWSNLCSLCGRRVHGKSDQWISGGREGLLRELMLDWLDGLNRWMDRLLEEWADQWMGALFKWCINYISEWLINFMVCINHTFLVTELYSVLGDVTKWLLAVGW